MPDTQSAGATPAAGDATSPQTPAPTGSQTPATGAEDQLGDAGKQALDRMKAERKQEAEARRAAESERDTLKQRLDELENASRSDAEKAIAAARKEAVAAERQRADTIIRSLRIEGALRDAGCTDAALGSQSREFASLKVSDSGDIVDLAQSIEAFKSAHPALFAPTTPQGGVDQGARGTAVAQDMNQLLRRSTGRA